MVDIYICEDEPELQVSFVQKVRELIDEFKFKAQLVLVTQSPELILDYASRAENTCLFFLDIELNGSMSGIALAHKLKTINSTFLIAFITAHLEYSREPARHKIETLDYIEKGINERENFKIDIEKAIRRDREVIYEEVQQIQLTEDVCLPPGDIICLEADQRKITMHGTRSTFPFVGSLKDLESKLDYRFSRISKFCIVNIDYVDSPDTREGSILMLDGKRYVITRIYKDSFKKQFLTRQTKLEFGNTPG